MHPNLGHDRLAMIPKFEHGKMGQCFLIEDVDTGQCFPIVSLEQSNVSNLSRLGNSAFFQGHNWEALAYIDVQMCKAVYHFQNWEVFPISEGSVD